MSSVLFSAPQLSMFFVTSLNTHPSSRYTSVDNFFGLWRLTFYCLASPEFHVQSHGPSPPFLLDLHFSPLPIMVRLPPSASNEHLAVARQPRPLTPSMLARPSTFKTPLIDRNISEPHLHSVPVLPTPDQDQRRLACRADPQLLSNRLTG